MRWRTYLKQIQKREKLIVHELEKLSSLLEYGTPTFIISSNFHRSTALIKPWQIIQYMARSKVMVVDFREGKSSETLCVIRNGKKYTYGGRWYTAQNLCLENSFTGLVCNTECRVTLILSLHTVKNAYERFCTG